MIDDVIGSHLQAPGTRVGTRSCRHDFELGQLPGQFCADGADATRSAEDRQAASCPRSIFMRSKSISHAVIVSAASLQLRQSQGSSACAPRGVRRRTEIRRSNPGGLPHPRRKRHPPARKSDIRAAGQDDASRIPPKNLEVAMGLPGPPPARISASTGLMPMAQTSTSKSRIRDGRRARGRENFGIFQIGSER